MSENVEPKVSGWSKFWKFIGGVFSDAQGIPSMNRVLSFMFGIASVVFGILMFSHTKGQNVLNSYEFWLTVVFMMVAMLGKNVQNIVEKTAEWKLKK